MKKIVTFGEIMLRLSPNGYGRFVQSNAFDVVYGGGESNVAVSLAMFGKQARFVTKLPKHEIGQAAINELRKYGVDTSLISRGGDRVGIYYCEKGASMRASKVIYDRAHSAIAEAKASDFDWNEIFKDAEWFHVTGITPALSENCAAITLEAVKVARANNVIVSMDLNYRKKLWPTEAAGRVLGTIAEYCDVLIANEEDAENVFGIKATHTNINDGVLSDEGYKDVAKQLLERFNLKFAAITLRESYSASRNGWSAMLFDGATYFKSKKYTIDIVDRVGGGDSFGAGLIYGLTSNWDAQKSLEFAVAASSLKHTIEGDSNLVSLEEVVTLMSGDASGRVQR